VNDAGAHAALPFMPHKARFGTLALEPYARPFAAAAGLVGAVSVSAPFTVSASVAVFDVPTGVEASPVSEAVKLRAAGLPTEAEEQL
jgi:hypothetical protein